MRTDQTAVIENLKFYRLGSINGQVDIYAARNPVENMHVFVNGFTRNNVVLIADKARQARPESAKAWRWAFVVGGLNHSNRTQFYAPTATGRSIHTNSQEFIRRRWITTRIKFHRFWWKFRGKENVEERTAYVRVPE
ncbi:hypothetical protein D3C80_1109980 [compost metagenome]